MWLGHGVLDEKEARRRVDEVVFTLRNGAGKLLGVNTVYTQAFRSPTELYYFYRTFFQPEARGSYFLQRLALKNVFEYLQYLVSENRLPQHGIVFVTENPKLQKDGFHRRLKRSELSYYGKGPAGRDIWYKDFVETNN